MPAIQGAMWSIALRDPFGLCGVALVGHPARLLMDENESTLSVLRVAVTEGTPNGCSMLYGSCARTARSMGARSLCTYTHLDEGGVSLRAAGWISDGQTSGGEHSRRKRPRKKAIDASPKVRWWAPWSEALR